MPILFTALTLLTVTLLFFQRIGLKYSLGDKISFEISYLVFTLSLRNLNEGKRRGRFFRYLRSLSSLRGGSRYLIRHSIVILNRAYKNDNGAPYALMAIRNYGLSSILLTFLLLYLKNNAESFTVADGAIRLVGNESAPKSSSIELYQSFTLLSLVIALLIFSQEKFKKRRLSYGRK